MRRATKDVIIADVNISKDENVFALIASANRDEAVFHQPDVFNIDRDFANVLTFGAGPHLCIGAQLAKLQTRIGIEVVTKRLGHLALANNEPIEWIDSLFFRGPRALNVNAASGSRGQWK